MAMRKWPRYKKSKPQVNSRDVIKRMSEASVHLSMKHLSDYNRYLNEIWYRTQIPHYIDAGMAKFT